MYLRHVRPYRYASVDRRAFSDALSGLIVRSLIPTPPLPDPLVVAPFRFERRTPPLFFMCVRPPFNALRLPRLRRRVGAALRRDLPALEPMAEKHAGIPDSPRPRKESGSVRPRCRRWAAATIDSGEMSRSGRSRQRKAAAGVRWRVGLCFFCACLRAFNAVVVFLTHAPLTRENARHENTGGVVSDRVPAGGQPWERCAHSSSSMEDFPNVWTSPGDGWRTFSHRI